MFERQVITKLDNTKCYNFRNRGVIMKVMIFDESHEKDLQDSINEFLRDEEKEIVDMKYQVAMMIDPRSLEQIYSFSCMIVYNEKNKRIK